MGAKLKKMKDVRWIIALTVVLFVINDSAISNGYDLDSDSLKAKTFREWALQKIMQNDTTAALLLLEESIYTNPKDWMSLYNRAVIYYNMGKSANAIDDINQALKLKKDFINGLYFRGMVFFFLEDYMQSENDINAALKIDPESAFLYRKRGAIRYNMQKRKSALRDFDTSIEINPFDPISYYNRYVTKDALNDIKGSKEDLRRALSLGFEADQVEY